MKFRPKNYKENLTKLMELSYRLNSMIENGSFYELSFLDRYREVKKVKSLYNRLRGPVSEKGLEQAVSFAAVLMLITGARCSDTSIDGFAKVTINLGLNERNKAVTSMSKGPAPKDVTEISLTVSGPGMDTINRSIPADEGVITLEVPAGDGREFEVRAETATDDYYEGSAIENLTAGEVAAVEIAMTRFDFPETSFVKRASNPFGLENTGSTGQYPSFADIDDDGDLDLFITKYGSNMGDTEFFKNLTVESGGTPSFDAPVTGPYNLLNSPLFKTFVDIDSDGDLDVYGGSFSYGIYGCSNSGSNYFFAAASAIPSTFSWLNVEPPNPNFYVPILSFVDIDADGDPDLFAAGSGPIDGSVTVEYLENTAGPGVFGDPVSNAFGIAELTSEQLPNLTDITAVSPAFADIDFDGDFDLLAGVNWRAPQPVSGYFYYNDFIYFENTGTRNSPSFARPVVNPFGIERIPGVMAFPALADIDGDGDMDLFIGDYLGNIQYFENQALAPDATPPANVKSLTGGQEGDSVYLSWTDPANWDFTKVSITFTPAEAGVTQPIEVQRDEGSVYVGPLTYGVPYTFTVRSVDDLGNQSGGASVSVTLLSK